MRPKARWAVIGGVALAALILGGGAALLARADGPPPPAGLASGARASAPVRGGADGSWHVTPGASTFVGYRIRAQLVVANAPEDAVGRSGAVSGGMRIAGGRVEAVHIDADLRELGSDQPLRDQALRRLGLETERYPMATFDLIQPIGFPSAPKRGQVVTAQARGNLTVHGVTRPVTMKLQARWDGDVIKMGGAMPVRLADYRVAAPMNGSVARIDQAGTIEISLDFARD